MTPQRAAKQKGIIYALIGGGFAGLIGAHEFAVMLPPEGTTSTTVPFILATAGTLCFIVAGLMARKLMKETASR